MNPTKKIKIVFFSDTHSLHKQLGYDYFLGADIAVFCGDMCGYTSPVDRDGVYEVMHFIKWFSDMPVPHKIFIAGNHDFALEGREPFAGPMHDINYLYNSGLKLYGLNFWGSPINTPYGNWAFNTSDEERERIWKLIPENTDILITHQCPKGYLDTTSYGAMRMGCAYLAAEIRSRIRKPKIMAFGHNHSGYGETEWDGIKLINCSVLNEKYELVNMPIRVEI